MPGAIVLPWEGVWPRIAPDAFIAPGAVIVGDVEIGPGASVWFHVTIRGDVAPIRIGTGSNVQDNSVLHVDRGQPCLIGADVTIGHGAIIHGTTIADGVLVGMGAIVLSYSRIGTGAVIAAGALVAEKQVVAPGAVVMGVPGRERRVLEPSQQERLAGTAARYVATAARYRAMLAELGGAEPPEGAQGVD